MTTPAPVGTNGPFPTPREAARALVTAHPALADLDPATRDQAAALINAQQGMEALATSIAAQGAATATTGWARTEQVGGTTAHPALVYHPSDTTWQEAAGVITSALNAVRGDQRFSGILWQSLPGRTVGYCPVLPTRPGQSWTIEGIPPRFGVVTDTVSANTANRTYEVVVRNLWPRFVAVYAEFLDHEGTPLHVCEQNPSTPPAPEWARPFQAPTRQFLTLLAPTTRLTGVALGDLPVTLTLAQPAEAATARLVFAGYGTTGWDSSAAPGFGVTAILGWTIPPLLTFAEVADPDQALRRLLADPALQQEAATASSTFVSCSGSADALTLAVQKVPRWLFDTTLPKLHTALADTLGGPDALADAAITLPWTIGNAALTSSTGLGGAVEGLAGPAVFALDLCLDMAQPVTVTAAPSPRAGAWPLAGTGWEATLSGDGYTQHQKGPLPAPLSAAPVTVEFSAPTDRDLTATVTVTSPQHTTLATGTTTMTTGAAAGTVAVTDTPPASTATFTQAALLTTDPEGHLRWSTGPAPEKTAADLDCSPDRAALCQLTSLSWQPRTRTLGYSWQSADQPLPTHGSNGATDDQLHRFQAIDTTFDSPATVIHPVKEGFTEPTALVFSRTEPVGYWFDPTESALRPFPLDPAAPFTTHTHLSAGRLTRSDPDRVVLDDTVHAAAVFATAHSLEIVPLTKTPVEDDQAPVAFTVGTHGSREGQLDTPVSVAATPSGALLVLEAGNHRIQAFDTWGNPTPGFGPAPQATILPLDPQRTYLDLDCDGTGLLYLLSHSGRGDQVADYRVEIRSHDGTPTAAVDGVAAAKITAVGGGAFFALYYAPLQGTSRIQPTLGLWKTNT